MATQSSSIHTNLTDSNSVVAKQFSAGLSEHKRPVFTTMNPIKALTDKELAVSIISSLQFKNLGSTLHMCWDSSFYVLSVIKGQSTLLRVTNM